MDAEEKLRQGLELYAKGELADAAEVFRDILVEDKANVDALNLLSIVFLDVGNLELAANLALQATLIDPDFASPHVSLGNARQGMGDFEGAVESFERALALEPEQPEILNNLASALNELGRWRDAADAASRAVIAMPGLLAAHINLGNALLGIDNVEQAAQSYRIALKLAPDHSDTHFNLGNALLRMGDADGALESFERAVANDPENPAKLYNVGNALLERGRLEDAADHYRRALSTSPGNTDILNNLASAYQFMGFEDKAVSTFRQALDQDPDNAELHFNLALALIQMGDFAEGWREYEARWGHSGLGLKKRDFPWPQWGGGDLKGLTILLHGEQGLGDAIQFSRFAAGVAERGGKVILECPRPLASLLATAPGVAEVVEAGGSLPPFDRHAPMMSLPRLLGTRLETVPADVPYLSVPEGAGAPGAEGDGFKVGFVWGGSATQRNDRDRSCDARLFERLFDLSGVRFFSFQVGSHADAFETLSHGGNVMELGTGFGDFADTAAAVAEMDLVISVDTAVAHLAGAMGRPVWTLLAYAPGFLWMRGRDDSVWYPTMRLFRQPSWGDWDSVFTDVRAALEETLDG